MVLDRPRVFVLGVWPLEPLARLDGILAGPNKRYNSPRVEAANIADSLQEDVIELVDLSGMLSSRSRRFVDWFKGDLAPLTR
jgi:hypothetical protein